MYCAAVITHYVALTQQQSPRSPRGQVINNSAQGKSDKATKATGVVDHSAILGKYSVGEELGHGGFSTVRLGTDPKTGQNVAIKIIDRSGMDWIILLLLISQFRLISVEMEEWEAEDVRHEAAIMNSLDHPNIVKIIEFVETVRFFYLIIEFLPGGELFDRIVQKTHYTERFEHLSAHRSHCDVTILLNSTHQRRSRRCGGHSDCIRLPPQPRHRPQRLETGELADEFKVCLLSSRIPLSTI